MNPSAADLFISHVTLDDGIASRLAARLEQETIDGTPEGRPLRTVYDHRDLRPGTSWDWWILEQARPARYMAVLVCPEITESESAMAEFLNHLYVRQDCLIPLWVRDQRAGSTRVEKIPPLFRKINYLDLRTEQAFEAAMPGLIDRIRSISVFEQQEALEGPAGGGLSGTEEEQGSFTEAFAILCGRLCIATASPSGERPLGLAWVEAHCYVALPRRPSEPGADIVWIRPAMECMAGHSFEAKRLRHQTRTGWLSYHTDLLAPLPAAAHVHAPGSGVSRELGMVYLSGDPDEPTLDYAVVLVTEWGREGGLELGGALEGDPAMRYGALLFHRSAALVGSAWQRGDLWIAQPFA